MKYQLPVILFSALSGSGNFVSTYFPAYTDKIVLAIGFISIMISFASSLAQYLKLSELSEGNRISYLSWEKFFTNIKFQLRRKRKDRDNINEFLHQIVPEYQRLKEISPDIPDCIASKIKTKKNYNKMHIPPFLNGFHPFHPYITQTDIDTEEFELGLNRRGIGLGGLGGGGGGGSGGGGGGGGGSGGGGGGGSGLSGLGGGGGSGINNLTL
jgi:uncharacterized membrane protein YgcG